MNCFPLPVEVGLALYIYGDILIRAILWRPDHSIPPLAIRHFHGRESDLHRGEWLRLCKWG